MAALLAASLAPAAHAEPAGLLSVRSYGTRQGLSNLVVLRLVQDQGGFVWVATEDGLFRYDGDRFQRFGVEDGLPSALVTEMVRGAGRDLWIGTMRGLARWDGMRLGPLPATSGLPESEVNGIAYANGCVWLALKSGLYRQVAPERFEAVRGWPGGAPSALFADDDGGLVAAAGGRLHSLSPSGQWTSWGAEDGLGKDLIHALLRDGHGVLWARSAGKLWSRGRGESRFRDQSAHAPLANDQGMLAVDLRGNLLVPSNEGLARQEAGAWSVLGRPDGLPISLIQCALEDREGSLWVGGIGLHRVLGRGRWRSFGRSDGLPGDVVWTEHRDQGGRLWVGTDQGLARDLGPRWEAVPAMHGRTVRSIVPAPDGALWLGGGAPAEVTLLGADGSVKRFGAAEGVLGKKILWLLVDRSGSLWAASEGAGLLRLSREAVPRFVRVPLPGGSDDERIGHLLQDRKGRLWAAGEGGLARLDAGGWRRFTTADGLRITRTAYVLERRSGELCAAYLESIGLSCFRPEEDGRGLGPLRHLGTSSGIAGARVYLLGEDLSERLWVGTGNGVTVLGPEGIEQFGEAQGLANDDTAAMSFLAEANGDVWVGTSGGLSHFSGARRLPIPPPPRAAIISAQLGQRALDPGASGPVAVQRDHDTLTVRFAGLTFLEPFRLEQEVRLRPLEEEWHATNQHEARYTRLAAGSYTFELRARSSSGVWSEPARLGFVILPAWWQRAWIFVLLLVVGGSVLGLAVSWTVRRRVAARERQLRARAEAPFRSLIERTPDVVIVHRHGRVVYANPSAATALGWDRPAAMVGLRVLDLLHPDDHAAERSARSIPRDDAAPFQEKRLVRRDGTTLIYEVTVLAIDFADEPAVLATGRDVTARKKMEARLLLTDRMALVGTLAAGVAHEINNPLAYIITNLDLIGEQLDPAKACSTLEDAELTEMVTEARDGAERVRKIVRGMKTLSRADVEERQAVAPGAVLEKSINFALNEIRHRARLRRVLLPAPMVLADESRLVQVFINLLVNAAHAIPAGHVEENEITAGVRTGPDGRAIIEIRDTGMGIPPELLGRIFDPFFTTKGIGEGTGLGLSICHGIVTGLGGEIAVETEPGKGTLFRVTLPAAPAQEAAASGSKVLAGGSNQRGRVLVIDDEPLVAASLGRLLAREHDVTLATDGEAALSLLASRDFDLVFCDLMMPRMTGMDLHGKLAGVAPGQRGRIVFMTGGAFTPEARRFLDAVPNERVEKPFDPAGLRALVQRRMGAVRGALPPPRGALDSGGDADGATSPSTAPGPLR